MVIKNDEIETFIEFLNDPEEIGMKIADGEIFDDEYFLDVNILQINLEKENVLLEIRFENEITGKIRSIKHTLYIDELFD